MTLDLIAAEEGLFNMIAFGRSEDDLLAVLQHPETMISSDGLAVDPHGPSGTGHPHPRYYGCYPRFLGHYVRERGIMSLEAAIHRCTGLVADTFALAQRGTLEQGNAADIVIFDRRHRRNGDIPGPQQFPMGVDTVIVNGTLVITNGTTRAPDPAKRCAHASQSVPVDPGSNPTLVD